MDRSPDAPPIVLHHYPQSPVAEKVRVVLGMKGLDWRSVHIPRVPPKPDLVPLTGGYRRTPVLQLGADVYCDSQCIIRELERRYPRPSLFPGIPAGFVWALGRWTDGPLFNLVVSLVLGAQAEDLPQEFALDRTRLYFGPDFDLKSLRPRLPHILSQLRSQLSWVEQQLEGGGDFVLGSQPGLADALCYYLVWFIRGRYAAGPGLLECFPALIAWEDRVRRLGHGASVEMTSQEALDLARRSKPRAEHARDASDPQGLRVGARVSVTPDDVGGGPAVVGEIWSATPQEIAILRHDPRLQDVVVHFPRVGYRVKELGRREATQAPADSR